MPSDYESVCYKEPFLKEVIVRLDFAAGTEGLVGDKIPAPIAKAALERFPIAEPRTATMRQLLFEPQGISQTEQVLTVWNYYGREREKRLAVSRDYMFVSVSRYNRYEETRGDALAILESLRQEFRELLVARLGVRYINAITKPGTGSPFDWTNYLSERVLGTLKQYSSAPLTRAMSTVEMQYDDIGVKFQFGMHNPDFPAKIRQHLFILDIDTYSNGLPAAEVQGHLDRAHEHIQFLFEDSITDSLRDLMKRA